MVTKIGIPKLMINGQVKSLSSMTEEDFEKFIPLLVKYSLNEAGAKFVNGVPEWWNSIIKFKFPMKKPAGLSKVGYLKHLSVLVCRCYWYHNAQYILPFCSKATNNPEEFYPTSKEGNASLTQIHNSNKATQFCNTVKENGAETKNKKKIYRRCLLPPVPKKAITIPDIYLCENCDGEFSSHSDMQKHEKVCCNVVSHDKTNIVENDSFRNKTRDSNNVEQTCKRFRLSEEIKVLKHIKHSTVLISEKSEFFNGLNLKPKYSKNLSFNTKLNKSGLENQTIQTPNVKHWLKAEMCLHKNRKVEVSSAVGQKMLKHSGKHDLLQKIEKNIAAYESYCSTKHVKDIKGQTDFKISFKNLKKHKWSHEYCFSKKERQSRCMTIKTGLNEKSRELLKRCRELRIVLYKYKVPSLPST